MRSAPSRGLILRLLLLAAVGLALVWVLHLKGRQPAPVETGGGGLPADWDTTSRWVFARGRDSVVVERRGAEFWIRRPIVDRADPTLLSEAERQARELKVVRFLPDSTLAPFALSPPRASLCLISRNGREWGIALGDSSPVGSETYALPLQGRRRVILIDRFTARKYFAPSLDDLRDRVAASLNPGAVDSVAVFAAGHDLAARRMAEDRWVSRSPRGLALDPLELARVVQFLRSPQIQRFPETTALLAPLGLAPPRAVWILYQGSRAESVSVGNPTPDQKTVYVLPAHRKYPALIDSDCFRSLVDGWPAMASTRLLSLQPESVRVVEFLGRPGGGSYQRADRDWVRLPGRRAVPQAHLLDSDVHNLCVLRCRRYPEPPLAPAGGPRLSLCLRTAEQAETLTLAAPADSVGWARSSRLSRWGEVSAQVWQTWRYRQEHP